MTGQMLPSVRDAFTGLFLVAPIEGGVEILFAGALLMTIEKDERLPAGFFDRTVRLIMDHLTGRQTALWDEQAVFGDRPRDLAQVRAMAQAWADHEADERERRIRGESTETEGATGSLCSDAEPDTAGHA